MKQNSAEDAQEDLSAWRENINGNSKETYGQTNERQREIIKIFRIDLSA